MFTNPYKRFVLVSACMRYADQLVVAGVPLIAAAVFKLPEDQVGAMIAAQGSAWLLMSLPAGVMLDRIAPLKGVKRGTAVVTIGMLVLIAGLLLGSPATFTFGAFLTACAAVIGLLSDGASLQRLLSGEALGRGNARLQLIQSSAVFLTPLLMGWLIAKGHSFSGFVLALLLTVMAFVFSRGFPVQEAPPARERNPAVEIAEGFRFVRQQPLLRGIVACALFWNMAFMGLAAVFVPYALRQLMLSAAEVGMAQSAMGVGSILAALTAGWAMNKLPPRILLFFGPAGSAVAVALLIFAPKSWGFGAPAMMYFLLGFGPIIWFVCQNTIRQLVTPNGLLGRVSAVIQIAIYGVRSIAALIAGNVAVIYGFETTLWLILSLFALSTLAIPLSALGGLSAMPRSVNLPA